MYVSGEIRTPLPPICKNGCNKVQRVVKKFLSPTNRENPRLDSEYGVGDDVLMYVTLWKSILGTQNLNYDIMK